MPQQAMDKAADQVEQLAGYLQSRDVNQIVADAEGFARSRPSVFLGGAFALGFLLSRFLKSAPASSRTVDGSPNVMQQGLYRTPDVPSSYEDVRGAPDVRVGYAQGPAGTGYGVPSGPR
jgi:hypothetical protein